MDKLERIKGQYILCNHDRNFALGKRVRLRYACEYIYARLMELNPGGIDPFEYLDFARLDTSGGDVRGAINALGHAKRAIHLTIDCFLEILGLAEAFRKSNFPTKLNVIQELEAFPTLILDNLNKKRNFVEHDYRRIDIDEVVEFIDITEMFLRLCYPFLKHMVIGIHVGLKGDTRDIDWVLNPETSQIKIYENLNSQSFDSPIGIIYYNFSEDKNDRRHVEIIDIGESNMQTWVPYLNTFIYCTKRAIIPESTPYDPEHYERLMVFQTHSIFEL